MKYNQPYGVSDPNASYINGNPSTGTMGSIPPAASIEYPQREIVNFIADSQLVAPDNADLHQLSKSVQSGLVNYAQDTGLANFYACNLTPAITAYYDGLTVIMKIANANTGPSVLNVNALGNKPIIRYDGTPFTGVELKGGMIACFRYDGTKFQHMWPATYTVGGLVYLAAPRDYYVNNATGNDAFDGLQATAAGDGIKGPFKTIQKAFSTTALFNLNGYNITIHVADGTYAPAGPASMPVVNGSGQIIVTGNPANPQNVLISPAKGSGFVLSSGHVVIDGFFFTGTVLDPSNPADICCAIWTIGGNVTVKAARFGPCVGGHMTASGGFISGDGPFTVIAGNSMAHFRADAGGIVELNPINKPTMNLIGTPYFTSAFIIAGDLAVVRGTYLSITGTATGIRYSATTNSIINSNGAGANYYPGNSPGVLSSGAQYV